MMTFQKSPVGNLKKRENYKFLQEERVSSEGRELENEEKS